MQGVSQGYGDGRLLRSNTLPTPWGRSEYRAPNKDSIIRGSLSPDREEDQFQISGPERLSGKVSYSSGPWQDEEDNILLNARSRGHGWKQIQKEYFPSKSSNACRKRYERLIAKKRGSSWDEAKFEKLGILYKQLREQIWMPLAEVMDESWEDVEKAVSPFRICFKFSLHFPLIPDIFVCTYMANVNLVFRAWSQVFEKCAKDQIR